MKKLSAAVLLLTLFVSFQSFSQTKKLPSLQLTNLKGEKVNVADLHKSGKIIILDFWATWCIPCKKELNNINEVYAEWQKKYNVEIVAVSLDDAKSSAKVNANVNGAKWPYSILLDPNQDLRHALNFQNPPYTVLLDRDGNIVYTHVGYVDGDEFELEEQIKKVATK